MTDTHDPPPPAIEPPKSLASIGRANGVSPSAIYKRKSRGQVIDGPARVGGPRICPKCQHTGHYAKTCGKPRARRG